VTLSMIYESLELLTVDWWLKAG